MQTHSFQRLAALICGLVGSAALAVDATAPGFLLSRYEASERGSRFFTQESLDWRTDGAPSLGVVFDYSHKPLALYRVTSDGQQEVITIVRELAVAHVGGSWTTGAFRVGIDLPVVVYAEGTSGQIGLTTYAAPQRSGVGDLRLSGDWLFTGTANSAFRAALGVRLNLPTGDAQAYAGDGAFRGSALISLAGTPVSAFVWSARAGVTLKGKNFAYAGAQVGHEAFIGAAAGWQTLEGRLLIGPELLASTALAQAFTNASTSVEVMLGAHFNVTPSWRIGLAGGRGTTTALGSPVARVLASVEWAPMMSNDDACRAALAAHEQADLEAQRQADVARAAEAARLQSLADAAAAQKQAHDRQLAEEEAARRQANADDDGDGIANGVDACPAERGLGHATAAKNGCPSGALVGDELVIENVQFATGSDVILPASDESLSKVLAAIEKLPSTYRYRIEGHTDDRGDASINKDLSQRRASSVMRWFEKHGQPASRFTAEGFGAARPLATNDSDAHRQQNRRVEFHVINLEATP